MAILCFTKATATVEHQLLFILLFIDSRHTLRTSGSKLQARILVLAFTACGTLDTALTSLQTPLLTCKRELEIAPTSSGHSELDALVSLKHLHHRQAHSTDVFGYVNTLK